MSQARATTNHNEIRPWVEARKGHAAFVNSTRSRKRDSEEVLRIDSEADEASLDAISWDEFFATFESSDRDRLSQDPTASGRLNRFEEFSRDSLAQDDEAGSGTTQAAAGKKSVNDPSKPPAGTDHDEEEIDELEEEEIEEDEEDSDDDEDDEDDGEDDEDEDDEDDDEEEDDEDDEDDR